MSLDTDDNILVGAGTGGSTQGANVATDYVASRHYQIFKQAFGDNDTATPVGDGSDNSRPLPTRLFQENGLPLSAQALTASLSVLNVNLRGTSGSGNVPVDINAQTLGVVRVEGKTGGTPMGVCGDNFQIRTLFGATAGNTLTSIFSHGGDYDSVSVQGISGGHPVGITVDSPLDIRALTSTDQVTVAGTVTVSPGAGFSLDGGTVTVHGGATAYGDATSPMGASLAASGVGASAGLPVFLYGNSGGNPTAVGMSGDSLKVALQQTITATVSDITVDVPKASDFDTTGKLSSASTDGTTMGTPVLLYGQSGGNEAVARALTVTGGGALLTEVQGSISATISSVSINVPQASGYTATGNLFAADRVLSGGDVTGATMGQPALLYGASGNTAVGIGITQSGREQALLVGGVIGVKTDVANGALEVTSGANNIAVEVLGSLPTVSVATVTPTVTVNHGNGGITLVGGTLDAIVGTVTVVGAGFTLAGGIIDSAKVDGGVTGFGVNGGQGAGIADAPGITQGLPVFLYGASGASAGAVGMSGDGIKVFHESPISIANTLTTAGGVTGYGHPQLTVAPAGERGIATLLYGNSGGTASAIGMSGDHLKVSLDPNTISVTTGEVIVPENMTVQNFTDTRLAVGLSGDTLVPAGDTFHDGTVLTKNTHVFGLTGGRNNAFGLTAGGTYGSSIMVTGFSGPGTAVQSQDQFLADIVGGITGSIVSSIWGRRSDGTPNDSSGDLSLWDKVEAVRLAQATTTQGLVSISNAAGSAASAAGTISTAVNSVIAGDGETDFNGQPIPGSNDALVRVDVNGIKLPNAATPGVGNTAGLLPDISVGENAVRLSAHTLTKGVNIKNTSGTGIIHIGFSEDSVDGASPGGYDLHSREEVFIETDDLQNLWVASCPGASGCYIGG